MSALELPQKDGAKIIDEMKPLKDYLQGKTTAITFIEECRNIVNTEDADFEVIQPKQIENE